MSVGGKEEDIRRGAWSVDVSVNAPVYPQSPDPQLGLAPPRACLYEGAAILRGFVSVQRGLLVFPFCILRNHAPLTPRNEPPPLALLAPCLLGGELVDEGPDAREV